MIRPSLQSAPEPPALDPPFKVNITPDCCGGFTVFDVRWPWSLTFQLKVGIVFSSTTIRNTVRVRPFYSDKALSLVTEHFVLGPRWHRGYTHSLKNFSPDFGHFKNRLFVSGWRGRVPQSPVAMPLNTACHKLVIWKMMMCKCGVEQQAICVQCRHGCRSIATTAIQRLQLISI